MGAAALSAPEFELGKDEADRLARAVAEVNKHYPVPMIDPKYVAIGALAVTAFSIYAPRAVAYTSRRKSGRAFSRADEAAARHVEPSVPEPGLVMPEAAAQSWFDAGNAD